MNSHNMPTAWSQLKHTGWLRCRQSAKQKACYSPTPTTHDPCIFVLICVYTYVLVYLCILVLMYSSTICCCTCVLMHSCQPKSMLLTDTHNTWSLIPITPHKFSVHHRQNKTIYPNLPCIHAGVYWLWETRTSRDMDTLRHMIIVAFVCLLYF